MELLSKETKNETIRAIDKLCQIVEEQTITNSDEETFMKKYFTKDYLKLAGLVCCLYVYTEFELSAEEITEDNVREYSKSLVLSEDIVKEFNSVTNYDLSLLDKPEENISYLDELKDIVVLMYKQDVASDFAAAVLDRMIRIENRDIENSNECVEYESLYSNIMLEFFSADLGLAAENADNLERAKEKMHREIKLLSDYQEKNLKHKERILDFHKFEPDFEDEDFPIHRFIFMGKHFDINKQRDDLNKVMLAFKDMKNRYSEEFRVQYEERCHSLEDVIDKTMGIADDILLDASKEIVKMLAEDYEFYQYSARDIKDGLFTTDKISHEVEVLERRRDKLHYDFNHKTYDNVILYGIASAKLSSEEDSIFKTSYTFTSLYMAFRAEIDAARLRYLSLIDDNELEHIEAILETASKRARTTFENIQNGTVPQSKNTGSRIGYP